MERNKDNLINPDDTNSKELKKISKLGALKNSKSYKKLTATATAVMLAHTVQVGNVDAAQDKSFNSNQEQQLGPVDFLGFLRGVLGEAPTNRDYEEQKPTWTDPNVNDIETERQINELNKAISNAISHINNSSNQRERQQYINELNQLLKARDSLQGANTNNSYDYNHNRYEHNERFSTIRTTFGSNSNYWSNNPDKNDRMRDLEKHHVSYRFYDTKHGKEKFDRLTGLHQVDENGRSIGRFDKMLSNGESVLLKFVFKHRSEIVQVSYNNRVLKVRPINRKRSKEIYITRSKLKHRGGTHKITFGKGANKRGDGYRMALFLTLEK